MNTHVNEYLSLDQAYAHFNAALFAGALPACLITLQRKPGARGYYAPRRFTRRQRSALLTDVLTEPTTPIGSNATDEIALNPENFSDRTDKEILSTLVHEMVHLWQDHFGKPGRGRYHNEQWAKKMLDLGLKPMSIDKPGTMTGQSVTHEIIPAGLFDGAADQLLAQGFRLHWQSDSLLNAEKKPSKVKYSCPACEQNAWAKPSANLICGDCLEPMPPA